MTPFSLEGRRVGDEGERAAMADEAQEARRLQRQFVSVMHSPSPLPLSPRGRGTAL
jgi:hypothetical protein